MIDAYKLLNAAVMEADEYVPVFFDSEKHLENSFHNQTVPYRFFKEMLLTVSVDLRYNLLFIRLFFTPNKNYGSNKIVLFWWLKWIYIFKAHTSSNMEFSGKKLTIPLSSNQRKKKAL